jgi:hypothetical protein
VEAPTHLYGGPRSELDINILIVSEGYSRSEMSTFKNDALAVVDIIVNKPPFNAMPLQIVRLDVISKDSGIALSDAKKDTPFKATYNLSNGTYWIDEPLTQKVAVSLGPDFYAHKVLVLVNEPSLAGGGGIFYFSGRRPDGIAVTSNANRSVTLLHELGHAFGLADEYENAHPMGGEPPNVATSVESLPWRKLLNPKDVELPTVDNGSPKIRSIVGAFATEGTPPRFRPQRQCIMNDSTNAVDYCKVCTRWIRRSPKFANARP